LGSIIQARIEPLRQEDGERFSVSTAIMCLDGIEASRVSGDSSYTRRYQLTGDQVVVMAALGITEDEIDRAVARISNGW